VPSVEEHLLANLEDGVYRPVVDIVVRIGGTTQTLRALVDSGADLTVIPTSVAEAMAGKPFEELGGVDTEMQGVCGKVPAKYIEATGTYMGRDFADHVLVGPAPRTLVGRVDFMTVFNARFYWNREPPEFQLDPADPRRAPAAARNPTIRAANKKRRR
jgi:hypothetical protein